MDARRYIEVAQDIYIDTVGSENARRKSPLVEVLAGLVMVSVLAAILMPTFPNHRDRRDYRCQNNLKQMALGTMQYLQDYDERYPPATVHDTYVSTQPPYARPYGWADVIQPYLKSTQLYHCPLNQIEHFTNPRSVNFTDYWMNGDICQAYLADVNYPTTTVLFGDGNDGREATNARYTLRALPFSWKDDHTAPAWRHLECPHCEDMRGANYCYADGHVKWLDGDVATQGNASDFTFALK